jgi:multidrug resistance efflux pump
MNFLPFAPNRLAGSRERPDASVALHEVRSDVLRLPPIENPKTLSAGFAQHVSKWTLAIVLFALLGGGIAATTVSVTLSLRASGVLEPANVWVVHALETGSIASVAVSTGEAVKRGQVLAVLDSLELAQQRVQLEGEIRTQQAAVARLRAASPFERQQRQYQGRQAVERRVQAAAALRDRLAAFGYGTNVDSIRQNYVSGSHVEIDRATSELLLAEAEVEHSSLLLSMPLNASLDESRERAGQRRLQELLRVLRVREQRLTIRSPGDGIVTTAETGRLAGTSVREGDAVLHVADLTQWRARLFLADRDVHDVAIGDSVRIEGPALRHLADQDLHGVVEFIAPAPVAAETGGSGAAAMYEVHARITDRTQSTLGVEQLRTGLSVNGRIVTRSGLIASLGVRYLRDRFGPRK